MEKTKNERQKKIISGKVKVKKKHVGQSIAEEFINEDVSSVKSHILSEVIIPGIKRIIYDAGTGALGSILGISSFGKSTRRDDTRISYREYYNRKDERQTLSRNQNSMYGCNYIFFETRAEAENVLSQLDEIVDQYEVASVADYYDLVGVEPRPTDFNYGWENLQTTVITNTRDGFLIKLPKTKAV